MSLDLAVAGAAQQPAASTESSLQPRGRWAEVASATATVVVGLLALGCGISALRHRFPHIHVGWLLPLSGVDFRPDALGGLFSVLVGAVAIPVGIFLAGYARREHLPLTALVTLPIFVATMAAVPLAGSIPTFLLMWELMALTSVILVLTEHRREVVRSAGIYYAVLTQLGFAAILIALTLLAARAGTADFADLARSSGRISPPVRTVVFLLTVLGFGSKAGLLPLHAWLPRAHPEAPSPVSALMSGAMVAMGVYGLVRIEFDVLAADRSWQGVVLLAVGATSALYGVLQASVATDLKRLLAYSTTENMGLVVLALGAAVLLRANGVDAAATIALTAALLHLMAHAMFKALTFLGAGAVLCGSGLRDLDEMGGLARRMPATTVLFGVGALGACGLPLGAGFVSEWLLVQSLIHAPRPVATVVAVSIPLALGTVALAAGLGITAMVKAFGIGFLARPRTEAATSAREASSSMVAGMGVLALACSVLAVAPVVVAGALTRAVDELPGWTQHGGVRFTPVLRLPGVAGSIAPGWLTAALVAATVSVAVAVRARARREPAIELPLWGCGADRMSARMQYTATSFAEPLQRVFDDVLRPDTDVEITHKAESRYLVERVRYRVRVGDAVESRLYAPVVRQVQRWAVWARRLHPGSVHLYLIYGGLGLLVVLLVSR